MYRKCLCLQRISKGAIKYGIKCGRKYITGVFLDVPTDTLELSFTQWHKDFQLRIEQQQQQLAGL